jgi:formylglycine-generating enzyme required for sulfatase activity
MNRTRQFGLLVAAVGWLGIAFAQPVPMDYDPAKNLATERAAAKKAETAKQQAEAEAAELKRQLAEALRKAKDAQKQAAEAQKKVGAGGMEGAYTPLTVFRDTLKDGTQGPEMIVIPAGDFQMGSNETETEQPIHTVRLAKSFALGKTEVTQAQWRQVMRFNPSRSNSCDDCPVEQVGWDDAQAFISKLNELTGKIYRLPNEAEWEYAAKAGSNFKYSGGDDIEAVAWYSKNSGLKTHPVGRKKPNAWGLFDMTGNVWEWVEDSWHDSYKGAPRDGSAWVTGGDAGRRGLRGGSWGNDPNVARTAFRFSFVSTFRFDLSGFRLARMLP